MSKRWMLSSGFHPLECLEDRISELPDEMLLEILSRLTLKEAAQTSIISRRWKTLWTFATKVLDFADPVALAQLEERYSLPFLENKRNKYTKWVNQVLKSHKGEIIDAFKVCFNLDNTYKLDLDSWIEFAIQKKSLNLVVDLKRLSREEKPYPFPKEVLGLKSNIKILRALRLCWVDVSGPVLQDILFNCTSLEALSILGSNSLVDAKFCGPLKLKFIEIRYCNKLQTIEVSAGNLESLVCYGRRVTSLRICHAPKLNIVYLGGDYVCQNRIPLFSELSPFFSQIETLVLDFTVSPFDIGLVRISNFPELKILKWLELKVPSLDHESLLCCISMIKACPMLHRFGVEFDWHLPRSVVRKQRKMEKIELGEKLKCLKVVEFKWFGGRTPDVELAISILENAPYVETIIFDPRCPSTASNPLAPKIDSHEDRMTARECARQLANNHSPNAHLIVF